MNDENLNDVQPIITPGKPLRIVIDPSFLDASKDSGKNIQKAEWLLACAEALKKLDVDCKLAISANTIAAKTRLLFPELATSSLALQKHTNPYPAKHSSGFQTNLAKAYAAGTVDIINTKHDSAGEPHGVYSVVQQIANKILDVAGMEPLASQEDLLAKLVEACHPLPESKDTNAPKPASTTDAVKSTTAFEEELSGLEKVRTAIAQSGVAGDSSVKRFLTTVSKYLENLHNASKELNSTGKTAKKAVTEVGRQAEDKNRKRVAKIKQSIAAATAVLDNKDIKFNYLHQEALVHGTHPNSHLLTPALIQAVYDSDELHNLWIVSKTNDKGDPVKLSVVPLANTALDDIVVYAGDAINQGVSSIFVTAHDSDLFHGIQPPLLQIFPDRTVKKIDPAKVSIPNVSRYNSIDKLIDQMRLELGELAKKEGKDSPFAQRVQQLDAKYSSIGMVSGPALPALRGLDNEIQEPRRTASDVELVQFGTHVERARLAAKGLNGPVENALDGVEKAAEKIRKETKRRGLTDDDVSEIKGETFGMGGGL